MRAREADHHGKGLITVVPLNPLCRLNPNEMVNRVFPRDGTDQGTEILVKVGLIVKSGLGVAVGFEKVIIVILNIAPKFVFSNNPALKAQTLLPRVKVHLADSDGVVVVRVK